MSEGTSIEWADDTVNPWWGCTKVSPACKHCYAETMDRRGLVGGGGHWGKDAPRFIRVDRAIKELDRIARRSDRDGRPRRVFIASMADIFEDRSDLVEPRQRLWDHLHALGRRITPMLLTKRPEVMVDWVERYGLPDGAWCGVTVEDQQRADERIPRLLQVPAEVRFLSMEPLLAGVNLDFALVSRWHDEESSCFCDIGPADADVRVDFNGVERCDRCSCALGGCPAPAIRWVIAGGESGPGARPMHPAWVRSVRDQCVAAGVPFFFKQWGEWCPRSTGYPIDDRAPRVKLDETGRNTSADLTVHGVPGMGRGQHPVWMSRVGKKRAGRLLDGQEWNQIPSQEAR